MFWKTFWTTWALSSKRGAAICPGWTQRWPTSRDTVPSRSRRVLWGWKQMANNRGEVTRMKCHGISTNHWGVSSWGDFSGENYGIIRYYKPFLSWDARDGHIFAQVKFSPKADFLERRQFNGVHGTWASNPADHVDKSHGAQIFWSTRKKLPHSKPT
jgi:hypothetical protein